MGRRAIILKCFSLFWVLAGSDHCWAKVSALEAARLGRDLTPLGAEAAGNADGGIPAWRGTMRALPKGMKYGGSGSVYPDPYAHESARLVIRLNNMASYMDNLSEGQKALLQRYPESFRIPVYPTHRDGRYGELFEQRVAWNATHTFLVNGVDGVKDFTGATPFPIPVSGAEVIWNSRISHPTATMEALFDDVAVFPNGSTNLRRQYQYADYPYAMDKYKVGDTEDKIGIHAGLIHVVIDQPVREKGKMTIVHEALDQAMHSRNAWVYLPGTRRVRRTPTVGYDTPDGPGGLVTVDDSLGFNGAMDRYEWNLLGKKAIFIPYHAYRFDSPGVSYTELLGAGHANPDHMRYELHRVWVVEAVLKPGARHLYTKRRFYIDEDSWQIALVESYNSDGVLWRVGILNTLFDFEVPGYVARAQMFHDILSGAYVATRLVNETHPTNYAVKPLGAEYFNPQNLRQMGIH